LIEVEAESDLESEFARLREKGLKPCSAASGSWVAGANFTIADEMKRGEDVEGYDWRL
jgi:hypothetical protein